MLAKQSARYKHESMLKGPFDSAGELVHYTLHLGRRRGTQREVGGKAKDSSFCLPVALFKL